MDSEQRQHNATGILYTNLGNWDGIQLSRHITGLDRVFTMCLSLARELPVDIAIASGHPNL